MRFFLLFFFFSVVQIWARCYDYASPGQLICYAGGCDCSEGMQSGNSYWSSCTWVEGSYGRACHCAKRCDTRCESQQQICNQQGGYFDSQNCECVDLCASSRSQCEQAGGHFTGRALSVDGGQCCSAVCNRCNSEANEKIVALKAKYCCEAGFAPPAEGENCYSPPGISGCGMTTLQRLPSTGDYLCRDPNSSQEASQSFYESCFSSSSADGGSSSSGGGGGSSSSGSEYPQGCEECPWLDSILDTLTAQKHQVDELVYCILNPSVCSSETDDSVNVQIDSSILDGVKDRQDSVLRDLVKIDSSLMKIFHKMDSLDFNVTIDSTLVKSIESGFDGVDSALNRIDGNIVDMDVETRRRLDSLISRIPPDIFDSIVKYQDSSIDRFDSVLFGQGLGFSLVDSLTDSVVKYFKVSNHYDSIYNAQFKSFDSTFKYKMDNLSFGIDGIDYSPLGYGDTASTTLRRDIDGVRAAIASVDSSVSGGIGDIVGLLAGTSVDTASAGYGRGFVASGQMMGDSVKSALGWGYVDTLNIDSMYARALSGYKSDSISQDVQDSLNELAVRLNDSLIVKTDSIKAALPAVLDSMADSLVLWAPFADFDSIIYSSIGAHIPNRAECPEACQKWTVSIPIIGLHSYTVDFGLCLGRASFAGLSVLGFLKLLIRIIVAYTCIMTIGRVLVRMI